MFDTLRKVSAGVLLTAGLSLAGLAAAESIIVQSTTSTANSGLYNHLLPRFKTDSGISVNVVAVGTGQAIRNASNCDGDVLLVHARSSEEKFIAMGFGVERFDLMFNDFILVGPANDPADIRGRNNIAEAMKKISNTRSLFASRGDDSGTHKKETELWSDTGIDVSASSGKWYRETGSGMGATLNVAIGMGAYVMTDRATWVSFRNKQQHTILVEGDDRLFNQYGIILVNPEKCKNVKTEAGQVFVDWMISENGQSAIESYSVAGQQLFFPNAEKTSAE